MNLYATNGWFNVMNLGNHGTDYQTRAMSSCRHPGG